MVRGAEPLSIESLLQKQKEEREAAARVSTSSFRYFKSSHPLSLAQVSVQGGACKDRYLQASPRNTGREKKGRREKEEQGTT
jgi:hypothetical protein